MTTPWPPVQPCHRCGGRGYRNLGTQGWCETHLGELFATFATTAWTQGDVTEELVAASRAVLLCAPTGSLDAWGDRLERAVGAELITPMEAATAWQEATRHVA